MFLMGGETGIEHGIAGKIYYMKILNMLASHGAGLQQC